MRIRLNKNQLSMIEYALYCQFTEENGVMDASESELEIYNKIASALEKEESGTSESE